MNFHAIGDLAQSMSARRQSASLQSDFARLTQELSSGKAASVTKHLNGNLSRLADIENQITLNIARGASSVEASIQASAMQDALEYVHAQMSELSDNALLLNQASGASALSTTATHARDALSAIMSALNTEVAGRPVFAGTALDKAPLVSADALLDAVHTAVAGAGSADAVSTALDAFFDTPGGGYETSIYQGGTDNLPPFRLGEGEAVQLAIRADDTTLRAVLKDTVMAALAGDDSLALDTTERLELMRGAAGSMRAQLDGVAQLRADLGLAQERIEQSSTRNAAERTSLQMAQSELLSIDKLETVSALEEVQLQLEMIYTLISRMSRLNLVNFL